MASTPVPRRVRWAVDILDVRPDDHLLEIGCGTGIAVSLVCDRLAGGSIIAIDRSATAVRRAEVRNAGHIASGKATIRKGDVADLSLPGRQFDKIFAINVNVFWVRPTGAALLAVKRLLRPQGTLYLFFEAPGPDRATGNARSAAAALAHNDFTTRLTAPRSAPLACVTANLTPPGARVRDAR